MACSMLKIAVRFEEGGSRFDEKFAIVEEDD
jgi:hypothetical protein